MKLLKKERKKAWHLFLFPSSCSCGVSAEYMRGTPGLCIPWGSHQVLRPARHALIYHIFLPEGLGAKKPLQPAEAETGSRAQSQRPAKHPPSARTRRRPPLEQLGREPGHSRAVSHHQSV